MNYKRILSNNSINSPSSSGTGVTHSEELSELNSEIGSLKQVIESLKTSIENRDTAVGALAREKEKVFVELKSAQRTIRSLRQQMNDERTIFIKEKEYLAEEIQRLSKNINTERKPQRHRHSKQNSIVENEQEIHSLRCQLLEKDETICKLCEKYMKLKHSKSHIYKKLKRLKIESEETRRITISHLEENRRKMDETFRKILKSSSVSKSGKKYLKLLKKNIKLSTENIQLKIGLSTNTHIEDKNEAKLYEDHEVSSSVDLPQPPPQLQDLSRQKIVPSEDDFYCGPKPHRSRLKWHPFKLKKANYWFSPALLESLYRKNKSLSAQLLQESLRKSTSMPCLSLV